MDILTPHQQAALNYKSHLSLTANAGSGKTFVLSRRFLEILLNEDVSLRNIAAITFTEKAASELYKKIAKLIEEKISSSAPGKEKSKLEAVRRQLVSANISTIHSFCINILKEYPVEANLDANFLPIDEQLSIELIELSVDEMIRTSINTSGEDEKLKTLIRFFGSRSLLVREFISLVRFRKNVLKISETIYNRDEEKVALFFREKFEQTLEKIIAPSYSKTIEAIEKINSAVLELDKANKTAAESESLIAEIKSGIGMVELLKVLIKLREILFTQKDTIKKNGYTKKISESCSDEIALVENFFLLIKEITFDENSGQIEKELAKFGTKIIRFFKKAHQIYENKKKENGYLDYEDILLFTQNILRNENVREGLSEKYKYIMVDEYQDTNETQYNIFLPILDELKKGNLFVVGDEKQSIYMFRDAELEIFNKTKEDISNKSGAQNLLTLPDSFRMAPAVCLFTNELFGNLFSDPVPLFNEVKHADIGCARGNGEEGKIEILISGSNSNDSEENDEENSITDNAQAEMIAVRILSLVNDESISQRLSWKDIAILCRKRSAFPLLEKAFIKYKIPLSIVGGRGFYQRQTVYDFYNYFSFLLDGKNDTALIGLLRSPFFLLSDSDIFELSLQYGETYWEKLKNYSSKEKKLIPVVETLNENKKLSGSIDITSMLRKILNESDLIAVLASKPGGAQEIANLEKLVKLTINFLSQGFRTLYDYFIFLRDSIDKIEDEAQALVSEESDAVKIMTLHQAKGLEFPAVFLFKCEDKAGSSVVKAREISVNKELGILTKLPIEENYFEEYQSAPIVGLSNLISKRKNSAEIKRLLYVGITRAINYLFIVAESKKDFKYPEDSFISLIIRGLGIDLTLDSFQLNGELKLLVNENGEFQNSLRKMNIYISILKNIENYKLPDDKKNEYVKKELRLAKIEDNTKGEIISATKIAVFNQCQVKYELTYDFGFSSLLNNYKSWLRGKNTSAQTKTVYEYNPMEDEAVNEKESDLPDKNKVRSDVKGRIIHKILELNTQPEQIEIKVRDLVQKEISDFEKHDKTEEEFIKTITSDLNNFYNSEIYGQLQNYKNYKNEFEIYLHENDYYLYGIIDKIILDGNKIIIVDYKTDDVEPEDIKEKSEAYSSQLKFYAYLAGKYFNNISRIALRLIFIKRPEISIIEEFNPDDYNVFGKNIQSMVDIVRERNFAKNLHHCVNCYFAINRWCIKKEL